MSIPLTIVDAQAYRNERFVIFRKRARWRSNKRNNTGGGLLQRDWKYWDYFLHVSGLTGCNSLVCKRKWLVINMFVNFEPVERFKNWRHMTRFCGFDNSRSDWVLDVQKTILFENLVDYSKVSYSTQVWSERWGGMRAVADDDDDEIAYFTVRWKTRASFVYLTKNMR